MPCQTRAHTARGRSYQATNTRRSRGGRQITKKRQSTSTSDFQATPGSPTAPARIGSCAFPTRPHTDHGGPQRPAGRPRRARNPATHLPRRRSRPPCNVPAKVAVVLWWWGQAERGKNTREGQTPENKRAETGGTSSPLASRSRWNGLSRRVRDPRRRPRTSDTPPADAHTQQQKDHVEARTAADTVEAIISLVLRSYTPARTVLSR